MPAPKRKNAVQLQKQCDAWNAKYPEGTVVSYESIIGEGETHRGKTRSEAQVAGGHSAVIWLEGKSGWVCLDHCTVVAEKAPQVIRVTFEDRGQDFIAWYVRDGIVIDCQPFQGMVWVGTRIIYPQGLPLAPGRIINLISPVTGKVSDLKTPVASVEALSEDEASWVEVVGRGWADMKGINPSELGL